MINTVGLQTLYKKETLRFFRVYNQTLIAPIINAILFFIIFALTLSGGNLNQEISYNMFLISGLVVMSAINGAYNNGIFIVVNKVTGNIIDFITIPLTPNEILIGLCGAAVTRSFCTAILIYLTLCLFHMEFPMYNIFITLFYIFISSIICALIGIISGLLFNNFEEASLITNYAVTPLLFLSGTFYSISKLPPFFQTLTNFNPFFYMIDGTRYGLIGISDRSLITGSIILITFAISLWLGSAWILKSGYRIRK